ncbi:hypothetical protein F511_46061 [Dorcoceras hygrometricum]|uniref:Uncharacterized protein n=1 Tax=Dorcoceras hygrometricum TaxID=472368 RepID=A0A2Z6ZUG4_9LAMI|nr:hypothetical protein F511_46061 [Dorcoceras hygrometricum]
MRRLARSLVAASRALLPTLAPPFSTAARHGRHLHGRSSRNRFSLDGTLLPLVGWMSRTHCAAMLRAGCDAARRRTANVAFDAACMRPLPHAIFVGGGAAVAGRRSGESPAMS